MLPAGYIAKRVYLQPDWLKAERAAEVYSVSGCISDYFADYAGFWKHNGYWFFNSPEDIRQLAVENGIDLAGTTLFYYEVYELEFGEDRWSPFEPERAFMTRVTPPIEKTLEGYDVVTFSTGASPECSPLSCNSLANEVETNRRCLLPSLECAKQLLEEGKFNNAEPGPYRIFAVYSLKGD